MSVEATKSVSAVWVSRLQTPESQCCGCHLKSISWRIWSSSGRLSFSFVWPVTDWMRPTHLVEGNLFYSEFINLNMNRIQKHPVSWHIKLTSQWGVVNLPAAIRPWLTKVQVSSLASNRTNADLLRKPPKELLSRIHVKIQFYVKQIQSYEIKIGL